MDPGYKLKEENPNTKAGFLSKLFFTWFIPFCLKVKRQELGVTDLHKVLDSDKSDLLGDLLEKNWEKELNNAKLQRRTPNLLKVLAKTFGPRYMMWGLALLVLILISFLIKIARKKLTLYKDSNLPTFIAEAEKLGNESSGLLNKDFSLRVFQVFLLARFIEMFNRPDLGNLEFDLYLNSSVLIISSFVTVLLNHHGNFQYSLQAMRCRIALSSLVYRKITRLNQVSLSRTATGQVVNLLSNDVSRFDAVSLSLNIFWIAPVVLPIVGYFMWQEIGISSMVGICSMELFCLPLQGFLAKLGGDIRLRIANKSDNRISTMNEIISGIQIIKMHAWEVPFEKVVKEIRSSEVRDIKKVSYYRSIFTSCSLFLERVSMLLTITCFVLLGNHLTSEKAFSMTQFFNILLVILGILVPFSLSLGAECLTSIQRLRDFLMLEEKVMTQIQTSGVGCVEINQVSANWVDTILEDISLRIQTGTLCAIVGPVGSGKSSLLQLLIGELPASSGKIAVGGEISYASQVPWLFAASLRNNILFGQPYEHSWYKTVVKACCLENDFEQFPQGDRTLLGDRGVSLSGGQKARVNLARAIYRKASIYLMDDPLSAVDTQVGRYLFDECICTHLSGKTRILVTHQLQYLKRADLIIVMREGRIEAMGTFDELINSKLDINEILSSAAGGNDKADSSKSDDKVPFQGTNIKSDQSEETNDTVGNVEKIRLQESVQTLWEYCKASGNKYSLLTLFLIFIFSEVITFGSDYWLAFCNPAGSEERAWRAIAAVLYRGRPGVISVVKISHLFLGFPTMIDLSFKYNRTRQEELKYTYAFKVDQPGIILNSNSTERNRRFMNSFYEYFIINGSTHKLLRTNVSYYVLIALIVSVIIFTFGRSFFFYKLAMKASKNLHGKMFHCLLQAPMKFFNTAPCGSILNRFSKDIGGVDEMLPRFFLDSIQIYLLSCGIMINIMLSNPLLIIAVLLCAFLSWKVIGWFISTTKVIKHLEGIAKSPVFSYLSSTLNGIPTIRSSKAESVLISEFDNHQDLHTSAWFLVTTSIVSFGLWLDIICVILLSFIVYGFVFLQYYIPVQASLVGLAISQCMGLIGMFQYGSRQTAEVVNQLTSVERILEYTTIETEGPFTTPEDALQWNDWPNQGKIEFKNVSLRYIESGPPVLKNLNVKIEPGQKIGIVGRTGAGKSSLIAALFRFAYLDGTILIDGEDTKTIGLTNLRKKISIIPQDGILFSATLRYNLDPFGEFTDGEIWEALESVNLKKEVPSLNYLISEGGSNCSLGQRQLICLARALLRKNKIFILDEATASMDLSTDAFIQTTIREKFKNCTVLTIAHRLNSIMDSDKVMVMSNGMLVEYDHPYLLLQKENGYFTKLVRETGSKIQEQLTTVAAKTYKTRKINLCQSI